MTAPVSSSVRSLGTPAINYMYGYKISGTGGPGYALLAFSSPADGNTLTSVQAGSVASALQSELAGLSGVTAAAQSTISMSGTPAHDQWVFAPAGLLPQVTFDDTWTVYGFEAIKGLSMPLVWLALSSPGDGMFNSTIVQNVADAVKTAIAAITGVTAVIEEVMPALTGVPS